MKSQRCRPFQPAAFGPAAVLVVGSALGASAQDYRESSSRTLEGTWWVQATTLRDCVSRTPLGFVSGPC